MAAKKARCYTHPWRDALPSMRKVVFTTSTQFFTQCEECAASGETGMPAPPQTRETNEGERAVALFDTIARTMQEVSS